MFKKFGKLKIFIITILVSMVFAVNMGATFAAENIALLDTLEAETSTAVDVGTYLNDVVVNNSTIKTPIGYKEGTVQREINFDYSFTEATDIAVKYNLKYSDDTEVNNVILNLADRDSYIWDQKTTLLENNTAAYNPTSDSGALYYLGTLQGSGTHKLFTGVTFLTGNNVISEYISTQGITIGSVSRTAGSTTYNATQYNESKLEIARFWESYQRSENKLADSYICKTAYQLGDLVIPSGVTMKNSDYSTYIANGAGAYTTVDYVCVQTFSAENGTYYGANETIPYETLISSAITQEERAYFKVVLSNFTPYWEIDSYVVTTAFSGYAVGTIVSVDTYRSILSAGTANSNYFEPQYICSTSYNLTALEAIIEGYETNSIPVDTVITAEQYADLYFKEQAYFTEHSYTKYENKNLTIEVEVFHLVNANASGVDANNYYTYEHYFCEIYNRNSTALSYWLEYKRGDETDTRLMVYNAHANFKNAIPYVTDFSAGEVLSETLIGDKSDIKTSYIYKYNETDKQIYFYSYAGGNKFNAGVGVYYMARQSGTLSVHIGANWYNSNGVKINSMPINNVEMAYNENFEDYVYTEIINEYTNGYIDILDYIQTITEGNLFDMRGYSLVITSITAIFTEDVSTEFSQTISDLITVTDTTMYNPVLYSKYKDMGTSSTLDFDITITNKSNLPLKVPSITVTPTFKTYNGFTGISGSSELYTYGIADTRQPEFSTVSSVGQNSVSSPSFTFDSSIWKCTKSGNSYVFTTDVAYIPPHTSLNVLSGVAMDSVTANSWSVPASVLHQASGTFYADYWFEMNAELSNDDDVSNYTQVAYSAISNYGSAELITYMNDTAITTTSTTEVYIGIRNNTLQIINAINFGATLIVGTNSSTSVNYSVTTFLGNASSANNTVSVTAESIGLYPGESLILCKLNIESGQTDVKFSQSSLKVNLTAGKAERDAEIYFKRDYASGNLTIVNNTEEDTTLSVKVNGVTSASKLNNVPNKPNGEQTKWISSTNLSGGFDFVMQDEGQTLAKFRASQIINLLSDYYKAITSYSYK